MITTVMHLEDVDEVCVNTAVTYFNPIIDKESLNFQFFIGYYIGIRFPFTIVKCFGGIIRGKLSVENQLVIFKLIAITTERT